MVITGLQDSIDSAVQYLPALFAALREMRRVVKPGGSFVVLNHFRRAGSWGGRFDDAVAPVCRRLGWNTDLALEPLLEEAGIRPQRVRPLRVLGGLFGGWQLLRFTNGAPS